MYDVPVVEVGHEGEARRGEGEAPLWGNPAADEQEKVIQRQILAPRDKGEHYFSVYVASFAKDSRNLAPEVFLSFLNYTTDTIVFLRLKYL